MRFYYGWVIMALSFLMLMVANGLALTFGVFLVPISRDLGFDRTGVSTVMALFMAVQGVLAPLVGLNIDRLGPRRVILAGFSILALAALALSRVTSPVHLYLAFGLLVGIGYSCVTLLTNSVVISRWFQKHRGLALGISISGLPVGPLVFSPLNAYLIERVGWQNAYLILAGIIAFSVLPLMLWLMRDGPETRPESEFPATAVSAAGPRWSVGEALSRVNFRRLAGSYSACGFSMSMVQTHFPAHALHAGMPQLAAATAFGMMGIWAIAGTVSAGAISDRYGRKKLLSLVYAVRMLALLLMAWAPNPMALVASSVLFGLAWTATGPLTSMLTGELYGVKNMGLLFGTVFFAHQLGATLGAYLGGALFDLNGSYTLPLLMAGAVLGAASLISYGIIENPEKLDQPRASMTETSSA